MVIAASFCGFPAGLFYIFIEREVEGNPEDHENNGENQVVGEVETGKSKDAAVGGIFRIVQNREVPADFILIVPGTVGQTGTISGNKLNFAGIIDGYISIRCFPENRGVVCYFSRGFNAIYQEFPLARNRKGQYQDTYAVECPIADAVYFHWYAVFFFVLQTMKQIKTID